MESFNDETWTAIRRVAASAGMAFTGGRVLRRYRLGSLKAAVIGEVSATGAVGVAFVLVVLRDTEPVLLCISQQNKFASFYAKGSHALVCVHEGKRSEIGQSDAYAEEDSFSREALAAAGDRLGVSAAPVIDRGEPVARKPKPALNPPPPRESIPPPSQRPSLLPPQAGKPALGIGVLLAVGLGILKVVIKTSSVHSPTPYIPPFSTPRQAVYADAADEQPEAGGPIAVDEANIFWIDTLTGTLRRQSKRGGATNTLASGIVNATGVALDSNSAWITVDGAYPSLGTAGVMKAPKAGGTAVWVVQNITRALSPAADDAGMLFLSGTPAARSGEEPLSQCGMVNTLSSDGGAAMWENSPCAWPGLQLDKQYVYWGDREQGRIYKRFRSSGKATALTSATTNGVSLAADPNKIYWIARMSVGYAILGVPKSGGVTTPLLARSSPMRELLVDDKSLWWIEEAGPFVELFAMAKSGGAPRKTSSDLPPGCRLAADKTHIYWATRTGPRALPKNAAADAGVGEGGDAETVVRPEGGRPADAGPCGGP